MTVPIIHTPVLAAEYLAAIPPHAQLIIDGTAGHGGHIRYLCEHRDQFAQLHTIIGIDRDPVMLSKARDQLSIIDTGQISLKLIQGTYADISTILSRKETKADSILLDIGVNMEHFKDPERGFSIKGDGPLDMRYDPTQSLTAKTIVNQWSRAQLIDMFATYADIRAGNAEKLTRIIMESRERKEITTTFQFKELGNLAGFGEKAMAVLFQALRIAVNDEFGALRQVLADLPNILAPGGKCIVMSYHSGEDTIVKQAFAQLEDQGHGHRVTKKVIMPSYQEQQRNKASRSAKLRVWEKG